MPGGPAFGNHLGGIASELAVTRSVRDTEAIFALLSGNARGPFADVTLLPPSGRRLRVGVLAETGTRFSTSAERSRAVEVAATNLEAAGNALVPFEWRDFEGMVSASAKTFGDLVAVNLAALVDSLGLDIAQAETLTQAFVRRGRAMTGTSLWNAMNAAVLVSRQLWTLFDRADIILTPMLSSAPLPIGSFPWDHEDTELHLARMTAFAPLAALANVSGFPAITLPFGADDDGLPLPVQMIAPMGQEPLLISLAARLESEGRWQPRFPIAGLAA